MTLNNKGFTLIEVLAVVVILSILTAITVPSVNYLIKKSSEDGYNNLKNNILMSTKIYLSDNRYDIVIEKSCDSNAEEINLVSIDNNSLIDSKIPVKYLVNSNDLSTNSNGNIINPLDNSKILDLNNSFILVKFKCSTKDYISILEDNYLIWK